MNSKRRISHLYDRIDYSLGKLFFGNTAGFMNNLSVKIRKSVYPGKVICSEKSKILASELRKIGFLKLGQSYGDSLMSSIRHKYNVMIEDERYSIPSAEFGGVVYSRFLLKSYKNIPELSSLLTEEIKEIVESYYGGHFKVQHLTCWRNYHVPPEVAKNREMFANNWHCDKRKIDILKLFVNLSDVEEEDGPFHIQSMEMTRDLIKRGFGTRENYQLPLEILEDPTYVVKAVGKTGTAMFANTELCLHKAGTPNAGRSRDIIQIQFIPSDIPLPYNWVEHVSPDVQEQKMIK